MKNVASARFAIKSWDEKPYDEGQDLPKLTRATVTKALTGEITGEGHVEYLMMYRDDGSATFMTWPAGAPVPAILVKDEKGTEGPVNFSVRGDVIVVDGVPKELVLRSGKDMATLENNGPPRPASPQALAQLEEVAR